MSDNQQVLDVRHLLCPLPVIRTAERVAQLSAGDELRVIATDPGTLQDVPAWCRVHGHQVLESIEEPTQVVVRILVV